MEYDGFVVWFTGLSGAGKTTLATMLYERLKGLENGSPSKHQEPGTRNQALAVGLLDGDIVRENLSKGLGFSKEDRDTNIRRIGFVAELLARNGVIAIVSAISPYRAVREELKNRIPNFIEVFVDCPLEVLIERDVKGLYKKALAGEIPNFTGVSDPHERPAGPDVAVRSDVERPTESLERIWSHLQERGLIRAQADAEVSRLMAGVA